MLVFLNAYLWSSGFPGSLSFALSSPSQNLRLDISKELDLEKRLSGQFVKQGFTFSEMGYGNTY